MSPSTIGSTSNYSGGLKYSTPSAFTVPNPKRLFADINPTSENCNYNSDLSHHNNFMTSTKDHHEQILKTTQLSSNENPTARNNSHTNVKLTQYEHLQRLTEPISPIVCFLYFVI